MKLDEVGASQNVEDQRSRGGARIAAPGITVGTVVVVLAVSYFTGQNPLTLLARMQSSAPTNSAPAAAPSAQENSSAQFVSRVLKTTEDTWHRLLPGYIEPKLVMFRQSVNSACGMATSASGPFYCPADRKAYLDLAFFDELSHKFGAPGDFAAAYVVAHEIGHHIQNLDRTNEKVQRSGDNEGANSMSVRLELQADCYAGIWAADAQRRGLLEAGDVDEALRAANSIGDDTLQRRSEGRVVPDSFTHGTSAQRLRWFKVGMQTGSIPSCDTFRAATL